MRRLGLPLLLAAAAAGMVAPSGAAAGGPLKFTRIADQVGWPQTYGDATTARFQLSTKAGVVGSARATVREIDFYRTKTTFKSRFEEGLITARGEITTRPDGRETVPIVGGRRAFRRARGVFIYHYDAKHETTEWTYKLESYG